MAHSANRGTRPLALAFASSLAFVAPPALALSLGEPQVRSALGEPLDLRIAVKIDKGESIEPSCFTLSPDPNASVPRLTSARVSLERSAQGTYLRIRSDGYVNEPALSLGVVAACPGQFAEYHREYSLLVDPRKGAAPVSENASAPPSQPARAAPAGGIAASIPDAVATLIARIGDTLESIANAIFPGDRAAKKSYIEAMRESNPPLAALGDRDPIPIDTPIALPDLRTFARAHAGREAPGPQAVAHAAPAPERAAHARRSERLAPAIPPERTAPPAAEPRAAPRETTPAPAAKAASPAAPRQKAAPSFVLKLSSPEVDLSRSRAVDERMRAQLRERLTMLDEDDQVAAVLALRHSVRELETKVADLQLKLSGMPSSVPPPRAAAQPKAVPAPGVPPPPARIEPSPPKLEAPAPAVEAAPAPVIAPTPAPAVKEPEVAPSPAPASDAKTEPAPAPTPSPAPSVEAKPRPEPKSSASSIDWLYYGLWALAFLLVAAAATLAWRLARRRRDEAAHEEVEEDATPSGEDRIVVADEFSEEPVFAEEAVAPGEAPRREIDSDAELPTRLPDNNSDHLRQRYIEERFPEIGKGAIVLEDPASVVKGARLFYEDGALARAVELLHYAIERKPGEVRTWLALFEIYRLERLSGEFAELARRFRDPHGKSEHWKKVQYFGREIDPGNELYAPPSVNTFETIGPSQAKRMAADDASFDPVAENWLAMPMDFQNEVLANELRNALMADAGIREEDLVPNPMPALRNIEMFSVA